MNSAADKVSKDPVSVPPYCGRRTISSRFGEGLGYGSAVQVRRCLGANVSVGLTAKYQGMCRFLNETNSETVLGYLIPDITGEMGQ